jgi:RND family efflux transporter MFP subunit
LDKAITGEQLKRQDVDRRVRQARLGVQQAQRQVEKAQAGIELQRKADEAMVHKAEAGVEAAKADLARATKGARPEQKAQAQIGVRQAERGVAAAKQNLDDTEFLVNKGGLPRVQLDQAKENYQKAIDGLDQAKSQLALVENPVTPEEIDAAKQQVKIAEAGLEAARSAANRQDLDKADLGAAKDQVKAAEDGLKAAEESRGELETLRQDIRAARAAYDQASSGLRLAQQQMAGLEVSTPVDGVVTNLTAHAGEIAGPGRPLVTVIGTAGVYLEAGVPARTLTQVTPGMAVTVTVDSLPGQSFAGAVRSISNVAGDDGRTFPVQVDIHAPAGLLKPGAMARAEIRGDSEQAVSVPSEALQVEGDKSTVWVIRSGMAQPVTVTVPLQEDGHSLVRGAIAPGDEVAISGMMGLTRGTRVEVRRGDAQ